MPLSLIGGGRQIRDRPGLATGRRLVDLQGVDQRVEQAAAQPGRELRLHQPRPPGVEDPDRVGVRVHLAVRGRLLTQRAVRQPGAQLRQRGGLGGVGDRRGVDHPQQRRQHLLAAQIGQPGLLDDLEQRRPVVLRAGRDARLQRRVQQIGPLHRAETEVAVRRRVVRRLLVVPAHQVVLVHRPRMDGVAVPAGPLVGRVTPVRQVRVDRGRPRGLGAGGVHGIFGRVHVEPVERERDVRRGAGERGRGAHLRRLVEHLEADRRVRLVTVGRAQPGERDGRAADRAPPGDQAVPRALHGQPVGPGRRRVGGGRIPRVGPGQALHRGARAVVEVGRRRRGRCAAVGIAQPDRVRVGDVLNRRRGAPRVIGTPAQQRVEVEPAEGDPPAADPRPLQLLEHQQLRGEVPGLRPEYGDRVAGGRVGRGDHRRVRHAAARAVDRQRAE